MHLCQYLGSALLELSTFFFHPSNQYMSERMQLTNCFFYDHLWRLNLYAARVLILALPSRWSGSRMLSRARNFIPFHLQRTSTRQVIPLASFSEHCYTVVLEQQFGTGVTCSGDKRGKDKGHWNRHDWRTDAPRSLVGSLYTSLNLGCTSIV